jgi:hypothetical protein
MRARFSRDVLERRAGIGSATRFARFLVVRARPRGWSSGGGPDLLDPRPLSIFCSRAGYVPGSFLRPVIMAVWVMVVPGSGT